MLVLVSKDITINYFFKIREFMILLKIFKFIHPEIQKKTKFSKLLFTQRRNLEFKTLFI